MSGGGQDTGGEKSFEPSSKRLEDARKKGDVARSVDLAVAASYLGLLLALVATGAAALGEAGTDLAFFLGRFDALDGLLTGPGGGAAIFAMALAPLLLLAPFFLLPGAAALLAFLAQRAFVMGPEKLLPELNRLDPIGNAGKKFGLTGLVDFAKSLVKMLAVGAVLWFFLDSEMDGILGTMQAPARFLPAEMLRLVTGLLAAIAAIAVVIGAADFLWQRFDHARRLRMSFQELRDEAKETEGDPHQKAARRRRAEEIARNQMMTAVPQADVVIVNPTHYAVALKWSRKPGSAPEVVAKGVDQTALMIRARAVEAGVPLRHDPPTARALHALVEIGQEVPPDLWRAVAGAIRFAEEMRKKARSGWRGDGTGDGP